ncbi:MAG: hypothetical protein HYW79_03370 [Parcubacteria group bacterium]|nr:hypothetical protein [Parcubacteria group bacterium]
MAAGEIFENLKEFSSKENKVVFKNPFFLFRGESKDEAPEEVLITTHAIEGNYGEVVSANDVATFIADLLNR